MTRLEYDALVMERVLGWQRYGAVCRGERYVVLVAKYRDCWAFTRSQSDPGTWEATTEPLTARHSVPAVSSNIADAWQVLDAIRTSDNPEVRVRFTREMGGNPLWQMPAPDAAHAICRAALAATEAR